MGAKAATIRKKSKPRAKTTAWTENAIRDAVERLEYDYGVPTPEPRFEPMDELVSCILTQHTSDANAYPAFERLKETYPNWDCVVEAGQAKLADVVRSAGLANQKATSIIACLEEIKKRNGEYSIENIRAMSMLEGRQWLMSLPGVGPKTASIVLSFAFGKEAIPVDTHVYRVAWRLGLLPPGCGETKAHDLLLKIVPTLLALRFHVALLRHGRQVCKAPLPICDECVLRDRCQWFREGGPEKRRQELKRAVKARSPRSEPKANR